MRPMQWVRLWVMPHLDKDSCWKTLDLRQRGLFYSLLVLAGQSNQGGEVSLPGMPGIAYTDDQLAAACCISTQEFCDTLSTIPKDMIDRAANQCLVVVNWCNYQTEYERQKGYRTKLHAKVTPQKSEVRSQKSEEQKPEEEPDADNPASPGLPRKKQALNDPAITDVLDWFGVTWSKANGGAAYPATNSYVVEAKAAQRLLKSYPDYETSLTAKLLTALSGGYYARVPGSLAEFVKDVARYTDANLKDKRKVVGAKSDNEFYEAYGKARYGEAGAK